MTKRWMTRRFDQQIGSDQVVERIGAQCVRECGVVGFQYAMDPTEIGVRVDFEPADCVEGGIGSNQALEAARSGTLASTVGKGVFLAECSGHTLWSANPIGEGSLYFTKGHASPPSLPGPVR